MHDLLYKVYDGVLDRGILEHITQVSKYKVFKKGELILDIGQSILYIPLILQGSVKVMREDMDKGELLLYYLTTGNTCTLTATCCSSNKLSAIRAVADTEVSVAFIPQAYFKLWLGKNESWRNYIFQSYSSRLDEMIQALDNLAFSNMEERVLSYLIQKRERDKDPILTVTHAEIANDLNSSRVVISRILKKLESDDKIILLRNEIRVIV